MIDSGICECEKSKNFKTERYSANSCNHHEYVIIEYTIVEEISNDAS